jgi:hypothetical protein
MSHDKQAKDAPVTTPTASGKSPKFLIFIDTNILLDFYRVRGRESDLSILKRIDDNLDRFITTAQVEMEFKKNRQRVILDSHNTFKLPPFDGLQLPAFVSESKASKALARNQKELKGCAATVKTRMARILHKPTTHDPVFKTAHRLFRARTDYNLTRENKLRFKIRTLAKKRFVLGYPPRKNEDTSIGDAINWEWIVHCASESGCHVVIVTRDSDYGVTFGQQSILNDWLTTEFRERVSTKRKLLLTDRLSIALKLASIPVTRQEVAAEEKALNSARREWYEQFTRSLQARTDFERAARERSAKAYETKVAHEPDAYEPDVYDPDTYDIDEQQYYADGPSDDGPTDDGPDEGPPDDGPGD